MASLNKVMLIGRLTDNPEPPRTMPNSGATVVKFRFVVGRSKKNQQTGQWENDPNPLYMDCEVWTQRDSRRNLCDVVSNFLKKGSQVYVEGRLQLETWDDKNGGGKRSKIKMVVESLELLDKASDGGGDPPRQQSSGRRSNAGNRAPAKQLGFDNFGDDSNDDIPF